MITTPMRPGTFFQTIHSDRSYVVLEASEDHGWYRAATATGGKFLISMIRRDEVAGVQVPPHRERLLLRSYAAGWADRSGKHWDKLPTLGDQKWFRVIVSYPKQGGSHYLRVAAANKEEAKAKALTEASRHDFRSGAVAGNVREITRVTAVLGPDRDFWKD